MKPLVLSALVVIVLAGCAPAAPTADPSPTAKPTASATSRPIPTATPTPTPTRPALGELVLTPGGFDQLPLGVDPSTIDPAIAIISSSPLECDASVLAWSTDAVWPPDESGHRPFSVAVRDGLVRGIQVVWTPEIKTAQGIGVGSTRQDVLDAYPGIPVALSDARGDVYIVQDDRGWMRMSVFYDTEAVEEMLATTNDVRFSAPSYHTIDADCL